MLAYRPELISLRFVVDVEVHTKRRFKSCRQYNIIMKRLPEPIFLSLLFVITSLVWIDVLKVGYDMLITYVWFKSILIIIILAMSLFMMYLFTGIVYKSWKDINKS
jgi:hypothetical protein